MNALISKLTNWTHVVSIVIVVVVLMYAAKRVPQIGAILNA